MNCSPNTSNINRLARKLSPAPLRRFLRFAGRRDQINRGRTRDSDMSHRSEFSHISWKWWTFRSRFRQPGAAVFPFRRRPLSSGSELIRNTAQSFALIIAMLWGIITYLIPDYIRPQDYFFHLNVHSDLSLTETSDDHSVVDVDIIFINDSRYSAQIKGAFYNAHGFLNSNADTQLSEFARALNQHDSLIDWRLMPRDPEGYLIGAGRVVGHGYWLAPQERYSHQLVLSVPCLIDTLQVSVEIVYQPQQKQERKDVVELSWFIDESGASKRLWYNFFYIDENGTKTTLDHANTEHQNMIENQGLQWSGALTEIEVPNCREGELPDGR